MKGKKPDYLFECSWEVCNKVGGIYTVVKSKAIDMKSKYKEYFMIGPYVASKAIDLEKKPAPDFLKKSFKELEMQGIRCYYGTWSIEGNPNTILIDFNSLVSQKNDIKQKLWDLEKIDSLKSDWGFEEPMLWSWACGMLLEQIEKNLAGKSIVGHFHEWLAGFSIFYLKNKASKIGTVFTTHATMLGRTIAGNGEDLYANLEHYNPDERAYNYGVQDKYLTEKAAAQRCDVFTTVSEITAIEAEKILGRKPDVILNNGLSIKNFPTIEETSMKHLIARDKIREFIMSYFFPYYTFDLDHNLIFFIVGRYEYKNKGLDVFIKALGELNEKLKKSKSKRTVTAFFWIPMYHEGVKLEVLQNKNSFRHILNYVEWNSQDILRNIVKDIVSCKTPTTKSIFSGNFLRDLEKDRRNFKREGNPPLCTHAIDESSDPMVKEFHNSGLDNREDDKVKVVLYPVYLDGNDGLINIPYYEAISGCHLGVFPSYYEPWGYTPLETAALGVASLTTDLAGYGRFIASKIPDPNDKVRGIYVLKRYGKTDNDVVKSLSNIFSDFVSLDHDQRVRNKVVAKNLSDCADWSEFIPNYMKAHELSLK